MNRNYDWGNEEYDEPKSGILGMASRVVSGIGNLARDRRAKKKAAKVPIKVKNVEYDNCEKEGEYEQYLIRWNKEGE